MTNPLTSLDELIWKQFEKITVAANKRLGWNKYDLAQIADTGNGISYAGIGVYGLIAGLSGERYQWMLLSFAICLPFGVVYHKASQQKNKRKYDEEVNLLVRTGAARTPTMDPERPLQLAVGGFMFGLGISALSGYYPTFFSAQGNYLWGMLSALAGTGHLSMVSANYFRSQIMIPPSTKKSIWKALADYVTKPFHQAAPQPVEVPAEIIK